MNNLININQNLTMSSREIAELTGKQHKDVLYDIRKMLIDLELTTAEFSAVYKADNGQEYECFNLDKENTLILVSGYNVKIRQAIIRRWQELENQQQFTIPQTYGEALIECGRLALEVEAQTKRIDKLIHTDNSYTTTHIAKEAGFKSANELNRALASAGYIYKQRGVWVLFSKYSGKGYQEIKQTELDNGKIIYNATWTSLGREWLLDVCGDM